MSNEKILTKEIAQQFLADECQGDDNSVDLGEFTAGSHLGTPSDFGGRTDRWGLTHAGRLTSRSTFVF